VRAVNNTNTPRQYTNDEVKEMFLQHVKALVQYWAGGLVGDKPAAERLDGLAFSILATIDGSSAVLPAFILAPMPHSGDKDYNLSHGENWFPEAPDVECDIAGTLHDCYAGRSNRK
jgi:hypothetical protein